MSFLFRFSIRVCVLSLVALPADGAESRKPNIIVIFCDDLGYGDLGCYGAADIRMPHLDRMAKESMLLTDFSMVAPLCTPSRAALLTFDASPAFKARSRRGLYGEDPYRGDDETATGDKIAECHEKIQQETVKGIDQRMNLLSVQRLRPTHADVRLLDDKLASLLWLRGVSKPVAEGTAKGRLAVPKDMIGPKCSEILVAFRPTRGCWPTGAKCFCRWTNLPR